MPDAKEKYQAAIARIRAAKIDTTLCSEYCMTVGCQIFNLANGDEPNLILLAQRGTVVCAIEEINDAMKDIKEVYPLKK